MVIPRKRKVDPSQLSWGVLREMEGTLKVAQACMEGRNYFFCNQRIECREGFWVTRLLPDRQFHHLDFICEAIVREVDFQEGIKEQIDEFFRSIGDQIFSPSCGGAETQGVPGC